MKNKRLFILSLIVLSVVMIGVQETFPNLLTTGLMTVVIAVAVFNILKESLNKKMKHTANEAVESDGASIANRKNRLKVVSRFSYLSVFQCFSHAF